MAKENSRGRILTEFPTKKCKNGSIRYDYDGFVGKEFEFEYKGEKYKDKIKIIKTYFKGEKGNKKRYFDAVYKDIVTPIEYNAFVYGFIGNVIGARRFEHRYSIGERVVNNKLDITIRECVGGGTTGSEKGYIFKCNVCEWEEGYISETNLKNETYGCGCCSGRVLVPHINSAYAKARWLEGLGISKEQLLSMTPNSMNEVVAICPNCNNKIVKPLNHIYTRNSIGCKCGVKNSYISKMIFYTLMDLKVEFDTEVEFEWCEFYNKYKNKDSYGRYDFVIKNLKIIIEADGGFHREDNLMNGQTKEESQYIDDMKDRLAEEHGYKVIRIDDVGNVQQNILNSKLNEVLNLEKVNWGEIQLNATSNKVKTVCEMYEEGYSCLELAKLTKLSRASICKYLRKGNEMGWCNYDGKTNAKYNSVPNGGYVVLKDGDFIEHFLSLKDMKQYFKDNKNMTITTEIISSELKKGIKIFNYKEYDFMYFDNYNKIN